MDGDREAIRLKIRARIMALADELTDKIMSIGRDVAREQLLQMVGELEVRAIEAVSDAGEHADRTSRHQAVESFQVQVIPPAAATAPPRSPNGREMQMKPASPDARTADGKKLPTCKRCGFYGGNTRGCGRSHRTLSGATPAADDDGDAEPPRDGHACSWLAVPAADGAGAPPSLPVRRQPAPAVRPTQAPVAAVEAAAAAPQAAVGRAILVAEVMRRVDTVEPHAPPTPKKTETATPADDGPGTPCTVGTRAADKATTTDAPLRLGIDKREVCQLHGWVGSLRFLRERHDLCEGGEHVAPDVELEAAVDEDGEPIEPVVDEHEDKPPTFIGPHRRRRRNPDAERAKTVPLKKITRADLHDDGIAYASELAELDKIRPRNRSQCVNGMRPCPFMGCRYHLALDVNPETGSIKIAFPDRDLDELSDTCALDVADRGGVTLEVAGALLNVTRERLRQLEYKAVMTLKGSGQAGILRGEELEPPPDHN